jgi:hypothetical protein
VISSKHRFIYLHVLKTGGNSIQDLLRDGKVLRPHHVIRYENLAADFDRATTALGLPVSSAQLPHLNRSADTAGLRAELAADAQLREEVAQRFKADMQLMDFAERAAPAA